MNEIVKLPWFKIARKVQAGGWTAAAILLLQIFGDRLVPGLGTSLAEPLVQSVMTLAPIIAAYVTPGRKSDPQ